MGMRVLAVDAVPVPASVCAELRIEFLGGPEKLGLLLRDADYVSLHVPLVPSTRHLINTETLAKMKPTATLINVSRGGVVDEAALLDAGREIQLVPLRAIGIAIVVPGLEASVSRGRFDFYLEGEYVRDSNARDDSYLYAWTELGFTPLEWLRLGAVAQRTKAYGGEREIQRGPFLQVTWGSATLGGYWFNPGSDDQVFVASIGVAF